MGEEKESAESPETQLSGVDLARKALAPLLVERIIEKVNSRIPIDPDDVTGSMAARERLVTALLRTHFDEIEARKARRIQH